MNRVNLLHLHDRHWVADAIGWQPLGWKEWFQAQGSSWAKAPSSLSTNKVNLLMEAVLSDEGVMLGWLHMVQPLIREEKLVYAHPGQLSVGRGNFLNCKHKSMQRPAVVSFVDHILAASKPQD